MLFLCIQSASLAIVIFMIIKITSNFNEIKKLQSAYERVGNPLEVLEVLDQKQKHGDLLYDRNIGIGRDLERETLLILKRIEALKSEFMPLIDLVHTINKPLIDSGKMISVTNEEYEKLIRDYTRDVIKSATKPIVPFVTIVDKKEEEQ